MATWVKVVASNMDKSPCVINLDRAIAFKLASRILGIKEINIFYDEQVFCINEKDNRTAYKDILNYIKQTTGHDLL
ncbi:MAG: hypothetical protein HZC41_25715 [Chloroflexi bacterium]|nr:hypothetical protein [Chloroflexota bacterium]